MPTHAVACTEVGERGVATSAAKACTGQWLPATIASRADRWYIAHGQATAAATKVETLHAKGCPLYGRWRCRRRVRRLRGRIQIQKVPEAIGCLFPRVSTACRRRCQQLHVCRGHVFVGRIIPDVRYKGLIRPGCRIPSHPLDCDRLANDALYESRVVLAIAGPQGSDAVPSFEGRCDRCGRASRRCHRRNRGRGGGIRGGEADEIFGLLCLLSRRR
mmetsp:Transcript_97859/g.276832  ORF Transcript_97859/g.276832 Transcript_97859/m.276832 type:complete len:217 (-) Transcript_97859:551-1201(-)